jgi:hypothetical protein
MSQEFLPVVGIASGMAAWFSASTIAGTPTAAVAALTVATVVVCAWWFSPLPNRSGVMVASESGYWGFSKDADAGGDAE